MRPESKRESSVREQWIDSLFRAPITADTRNMMLLLSRYMRPSGAVSVPQAVLKDRTGLSLRQIARHFAAAKEDGLLWVTRPGYRKHTTEYQTIPYVRAELKKGCHLPAPIPDEPMSPFLKLEQDKPGQDSCERVTPNVTPSRARARTSMEQTAPDIERMASNGSVIRMVLR